MLSIIGGVLVVAGSASFWYLLPHNGKVHPFVVNPDVGSLVTIGIMSLVTFGVVMLCEGLIG